MLHKTRIVTRGRRAERLKSRYSNKAYSYEQLELNKSLGKGFRAFRMPLIETFKTQNKPATRFARAAGFAVDLFN